MKQYLRAESSIMVSYVGITPIIFYKSAKNKTYNTLIDCNQIQER